ncbi:MAG: glycosyltransferase family 4 protein, partial [Smithellaceae bacterium]|nr:glycosyltransferase family 4 protein [Smithellaceae bacterium]
EVVFVLPKIKDPIGSSHVELVSAADVPLVQRHLLEESFFRGMELKTVNSPLSPYLNEKQYETLLYGGAEKTQSGEDKPCYLSISGAYGPDLVAEVLRYGQVAGAIAESHSFDAIHAHDWMTVYAALHARRISGKPFVLHVHATEFDRSGEHVNQQIYDIERYGMESADHIVAVSHYTKSLMVSRYGIDPDKITVVYNAVTKQEAREAYHVRKGPGRKMVLFLGRITFQKGPDYFVEAAAKVLKALPETKFVMAGAGDMMPRMIERVAELGMGKHFHFTGFLQGREIEKIFAMSDLYVMPSVSEPFGISPLEAMIYDVPVIISKQSGVAELLRYAMKVDFWDVKEMANKMIAVLKYPALSGEIVERSREELKDIRWENAAEKIVDVYQRFMH